ncbi:HAMP domain-containing protein [Hymenobacter gummosus]|uniref:histidine kinase n=1 Tax=Hymenobacter gummosus TaxID=1776032 RepID=A0A431U7Q3_9BACT|nr:ATP-binding protein [Hymenobacter gummosus]RTQ53314.1 HAMP domain-containing protein [Hymenobacter gummosus]
MLVRHKLILRFMLLVVAIQLCLTAFVYYYSARARNERFYHRLDTRARQTASLLIHRLNLDPQVLRQFRKQDLLTMHNGRISIYDARGRQLFHIQQDSLPVPIRDREHLGEITRERQARFRVGLIETLGMMTRHRGQTYYVFMAGRDYYGGREFETLRLILIVGNLGALVLIALAGWLFAVQSLRPLARMVTEVEGIEATRLSRRVAEGNGRDEIAQLAITFNRVLGRLEQSFESQKNFLAHASHELRTPLANLLVTLETCAAYDATLPEARRSVHSAIEETQSIIELTNGLLALAKAEDSSFSRTQVALDECVVQAIAACSAKYPGRNIRLEVGSWPEAAEDLFAVRGNAQLLTTAVLNLLDNACKYSVADVQVTLGYASPEQLHLTVADRGIGMAAPDVLRVREPLYRADNGRATPGYGLGLAITDAIVRLHGGQLRIESALDQGTSITLELPAAV